MTFFSHRPTATVTTRRGDRLFSILVNLCTKIFRLSLGCHPLDGVSRGGPPLPPDATVYSISVKFVEIALLSEDITSRKMPVNERTNS